MNKVSLEAKDGKNIVANLYDGVDGEVLGCIIYVHMMPATKESWNDLAEKLERLGYIGLALDLRGHGESDEGPRGYESFTDDEDQDGLLDIEAAARYLERKGVPPANTTLIGASIGANLSLSFVSRHNEYKSVILLSAGINYKGIETIPLAQKLQTDQRILLVSSRDDKKSLDSNVDQNQKLFDSVPSGVAKRFIIYDSAGHGTNMLQSGELPDLKEEIIEFIKNA